MKTLATFLTAMALCLLASGCGEASSQSPAESSTIAEVSSHAVEVSASQPEEPPAQPVDIPTPESSVEPSPISEVSTPQPEEPSLAVEVASEASEPLSKVIYPVATNTEDYKTARTIRGANPVESDFLLNLTDFSYETASVLLNERSNINYSPLSLYYALSIVATGAEGETKDELFDLLNVSTSEQLQEQASNLYRLLYTDNEISQLKIANSLWLGNNTTFHDEFINNAATNFYASTYPVDFSKEETGVAMGEWISENTNGTLTNEYEINPNQILSIINTIFFYDEWADGFSEKNTTTDIFHTLDEDVNVDFMNRDTVGTFAKGENFTRSALSFKNVGKMVFILPDEDVSIYDMLSSKGDFKTLFEGGENISGDIIWQIPKFDFDSGFDFVESLETLGVTSAFEVDANFSGITDGTAYLSAIIGKTSIAIDEKGVEASAFTEIFAEGDGAPIEYDEKAEMILNRPFLYGITASNGTLLFMGICENPSER